VPPLAPRVATLAHTTRIKAETRRLLALGEDATVLVQQLACSEPGCPPVETVIAILDAGTEPRTWKLHRPAAEIDTDTLAALLADTADHHEIQTGNEHD
jgi:hypothetical protein